MVRVKRGNVLRKRHKKILKLAKGFKGGRKRIFKAANEGVMRSLRNQYRDRRLRKRTMRRLWITRINAAARLNGIPYSRFIKGLELANISINRKLLADIAVRDEVAFKKISEIVKEKLAAVA
jgi:large subunit ribosomal protein L20